MLLSLIVYAGSSQLIVGGLISARMTPLSIILTTFVVNLRYMLMAAALSPHLSIWPKLALDGFALELTDESFALHVPRLADRDRPKLERFVINLIAHSTSIGGTWLGVAAGGLIADIEPLAL